MYPLAPGKLDIGSATMRYIPVLFSGKLLVKYYDATVLSYITNTDYEGEISKFGDTVNIRETADVDISSYAKGQVLNNQQPEANSQQLLIDQGKYWSFVTEDVDDVQTDIKDRVERWTDDASEKLRISIDTDVLAAIGADSHASNQGATAGVISGDLAMGVVATPITLSETTIIDKIVDMGVVLDEQNVPEEGRFLLMPSRISSLIKKSELAGANFSGDNTSIMRTGMLGQIDRFTVFNSNLLAGDNTNGFQCLFGHRDATTFATQLVQTKTQDNPDGFGMLHRGLQVFGYKVVKPEALGMAVLNT